MNAKRKDDKGDSATERGKNATQKGEVKHEKDDKGGSATERGKNATQNGEVKHEKDDKRGSATERGKSATQEDKHGKDDKGGSATERGKSATQKVKNGKDGKGGLATERGKNATQKVKNGKDDKGGSTDRRTDSAEKLTLTSLKILIMNANGKNDKCGSPSDRRKNAIQNVVVKHEPHIILFQEFIWKKLKGRKWKRYPFPDQYVYKGHREASIMYNNTYVSVHDMPASDLDTIIKGLQSSSNNRLKRTFPMDFAPMSRMCISRITVLNKPDLHFICISWHGKHRGMTELKKKEYFEYWMEFLRKIREKYHLPILAAGDYNVAMQKIDYYVTSPFKLCTYAASKRRTKRGIVDDCIVTEDLDFSKIAWVNLKRDTSVYEPNGILDHDPVVGMLKLTSAVSASA